MAITTIYTYPLNGTQRDFTIPFEYLARRFVVVTLIGANRRELTLTADFRFISKTLVQLNKAWGPSDGYERIEIRRNTSATDRLVDFADGSILRAAELNTSQVQTLHVAEEARNMVADTISENADGDLDARGRRLVNLADAVAPDHAVTLRQEQAWALSSLSNRNAAEAARVASEQAMDAALTSRDQAGTFENQAEAAKAIAETARDQSVAAAGTIGNNVTLAQQARVGAEAAKDATVAAAQSVQGAGIPSALGNGLKWLRQKANEMGFEYVEAYAKQAIDTIVAQINQSISQIIRVGSTPVQYTTSGRSIGQTYPNNTGKLMTVAVCVNPTIAGLLRVDITGGSPAGTVTFHGNYVQPAAYTSLTIQVPPGWTYMFYMSGGGGSTYSVVEMT